MLAYGAALKSRKAGRQATEPKRTHLYVAALERSIEPAVGFFYGQLVVASLAPGIWQSTAVKERKICSSSSNCVVSLLALLNTRLLL